MLTQKGRLRTSTIRHKTNVFFSSMRAVIFLLKNPTKITHHFRLRQTMTLTTKMYCSRLYLLYLVLVVGAKVQLKNIMMILTSTSCSHVQKDDSFLPGSSG
jgi:hypothetical protein